MILELHVRYTIMFHVFYFKEGTFRKMTLFSSYVCFYCSTVSLIILGNCHFLIHWHVLVPGSLYSVTKLINYDIIYNYMYSALPLLLLSLWPCPCRSSPGSVGRPFLSSPTRAGPGSRAPPSWLRPSTAAAGRTTWGSAQPPHSSGPQGEGRTTF